MKPKKAPVACWEVDCPADALLRPSHLTFFCMSLSSFHFSHLWAGPPGPRVPPRKQARLGDKNPQTLLYCEALLQNTHTLSHVHTHTYLQMQPAHKGILSFPYRGVSVAAACAAPLRHNPTVADGIFYYISENRIGNTNLLYRGLAFQSSSANQTKHKSIRSRT